MTELPLDYAFDCYSPRSRTWVDFAEAGTLQLLPEEVERTAAALEAASPADVEKGRATPEEAAARLAVWRAIAADLRAEQAWLADRASEPVLAVRLAELAATSGVRWFDKVAELRRELEARRASYPGDVDKGRLAPVDARARLERLEAVHWLYWQQGFAWDSPSGAPMQSAEWYAELRAHGAALADELERREAA